MENRYHLSDFPDCVHDFIKRNYMTPVPTCECCGTSTGESEDIDTSVRPFRHRKTSGTVLKSFADLPAIDTRIKIRCDVSNRESSQCDGLYYCNNHSPGSKRCLHRGDKITYQKNGVIGGRKHQCLRI